MSHPDEGVLQELLDGELADADATAVHTHLTSCATCTALLNELRQTHDEATAIVERLDLDPPLVRRFLRRGPARRFNPRLMGLAASFLLVAGTAWLLRGTYGVSSGASARAMSDAVIAQRDTGSSVAESVDTLAPGGDETDGMKPAPAPAIASAQDASLKRNGTIAPAAQPVLPQVVAEGKANEAPPAATLADAEARLGAPVLTIQGMAPTAVEYLDATPDSAAGVRLLYRVNGTEVALQQRRVSPARDEVTAKQSLQAGKAPGRSDAPVAALSAPAVRRWETNGLVVTLEGMLPADSLAALARRVH